MPPSSGLALFCVATLALLAVPGPAVLYIVTQSVREGRRGGLLCVLGVHAGTLVHLTAATLGLSAILASSATAFSVVKYAGAAYLIYVGARRLLGKDEGLAAEVAPDEPATGSGRRLFAQGAVVNILNPKTALFFLAFIPQFVDPTRGTATQVLALGLIFLFMGLVTDSLWALSAGTIGSKLRVSTRYRGVERWVTGTIFVGLGLLSALASPARSHR